MTGIVLSNAALDFAFHDIEKKNLKQYIEIFFVGLLEGDGTILIAKNKGNKSYGIFTISLKYLTENENMLNLIKKEIGGIVNYERKDGIIVKVK